MPREYPHIQSALDHGFELEVHKTHDGMKYLASVIQQTGLYTRGHSALGATAAEAVDALEARLESFK